MRKRIHLPAIAAAALCLTAGTAGAAPVLRVQVDQKGDFLLIGNTLGYDCAAGTPVPVVGTVGACGTNTGDSAPDIFWRSDSPAAGQAQANNTIALGQGRSTAFLNIPVGATVTHAFLYWGATLPAAGTDTTVTLDRPGAGGFTQNLNAITSYQGANNAYQSVVDVTSIIQANGSGAYRVSGIDSDNWVNLNSNANYGGWWMAVFYSNPANPLRNLALYEGLDTVSGGNNQNVALSGFLVPAFGFTGKLGVVTYEGDVSITGDQLFFNGAQLSDAQNPAMNFFNGTRSTLGVATTVVGDLPQLTGTAGSLSGMDMDIVDVTAQLTAGQTSAPIQATSTGDVYYLAGFITSISTFKPDFSTSTKTAVDVNGGALLPGDVIQYTIVVNNTGNDASVNTVLTDPIPAGATYVPGSLQITAGANAGNKTDAVGDDQGDFIAGTKTVKFRLGAGANGTNGGTMAIGASTTVAFKVTVNAGATGTISNQATINAAGQLGAPASDTPTDGNGPTAGSPPTDIVIDQCATDADCSAPTPHCKVTSSPKVCVECLLDAQCPGNKPTCNLATNTCTCVASGAEICDGKDNDCNGQVDEGFNVGTACTNGVGQCANNGIIACTGPNASACNAIPGAPSAELCDNLDNNCDGVVDDGNPGGGVACNTGSPGVCAAGVTACTGGALKCNGTIAVGSQMETCDGLDNNCDGAVDEGFNVGAPCTAGVGACMASGTLVCGVMGTAVCSAIPGEPSAENCNDMIDNDCDGVVNNGCTDTDGDGLPDAVEIAIGTDPNDADSDDDGVPDGQEINPGEDSDGDGLINALDPDSDNDGLYDGTEMGKNCDGPGTDKSKHHCIPDGDQGATTTDPLNPDTDGGGVKDGNEDSNLNGVVDGNETDPTAGHGGDDNSAVNVDSDGDGLSDALETFLGSNPNDADTDDDGVLDGQEPNPADDTDGDGLINVLDVDSDNDGLYDGTELGKDCSNPATDVSKNHCIPDGDAGATTTSALLRDTDKGGVSDGSEDPNRNGVVDPGETDPTAGHGADDNSAVNVDSDGDGLSDAFENAIGSNPNDADTDDDGVLDGQEPNLADDTDGDGLINVLDVDSDNDGLYDGTEMGKDCSNPATDNSKHHCTPDADQGATKTSPLLKDTDHGGVSDGGEDANHNGKQDAGETDPTLGHGADDSDPANKDTDGDGLTDHEEMLMGTNPNDADSDDDGVIDGQEANPADDNDGDGLIDALDPDSDNDGLYDGTEVGNDCNNPATDNTKHHCIPDGDMGATQTSPLDPDTDHGGVKDGSEDVNQNGVVDNNETDPTAGHGGDDSMNADSDGDGLSDAFENAIGTNPNDADSDDDGILDGQEPNPADDTDGDGKINALDSDSDNDGLFDGTEVGNDCSNPATDKSKMQCIPDADMGKTKTNPLDPDTDHGSVKDGTEDTNHNGQVDPGERDPLNPADDVPMVGCTTDADCGDAMSGKVCDPMTMACVMGCHSPGNGCPNGLKCSSETQVIGTCGQCFQDSDCGDAKSGKICLTNQNICGPGCHGGGNSCPDGQTCSSMDETDGTCSSKPVVEAVAAEGNGLFCSANPAGGSSDSNMGWLVGGALAALAGARRRRRR